jgi:hypothetical protein
MEVSKIEVSKLNPAKYNPRKINDRQLSGLKESLKKFGFVDPVIVNKRNMVIVGGHQRCKAAEELGMDKVPVTFVDLSPSEEKALNVSLNSPTISGEYDMDILPELLNEIEDTEPLLFDTLNMEDFVLPTIIPEDMSDKNKEIDVDNFGNDLEHQCPKCGFEFND